MERIPNPLPPARPAGLATHDAPLVVAAGRLNSQKGFDLLIAAFATVARTAARLAAADLRLAGPSARRLQAQIDALGLGEQRRR